MPSEESKPGKKARVEKEEADDGKSIGSLFQDCKKKTPNAVSKSLPKVKKEEQEDAESDKTPKITPGPRSKGPKVKKEEAFDYDEDEEDEKPIKKSSKALADKRKKKLKEEVKGKKEAAVKEESKRKDKKVYHLPGQKRDPPEERDPLRIFYETLYKQVPHSEMAQIWMMESGLLSEEQAKKVFEKKQKKAQIQKLNSPMKTVSVTKSVTVKTQKSVTKSVTVKKKTPSPLSSNKKKTPDSKVLKQSKKRKIKDESSDEGSDEDFEISKKKHRVA